MCPSASAEDGKAWLRGKRPCGLLPPHPHSIFSFHPPPLTGSCGRCKTPRLHVPACLAPPAQDFRLFSLLGVVVRGSWGGGWAWMGGGHVRVWGEGSVWGSGTYRKSIPVHPPFLPSLSLKSSLVSSYHCGGRIV